VVVVGMTLPKCFISSSSFYLFIFPTKCRARETYFNLVISAEERPSLKMHKIIIDDRHAIWLAPPVLCDVTLAFFSRAITSDYTTAQLGNGIPSIRSSSFIIRRSSSHFKYFIHPNCHDG
jgi:hypothetical protein